MECLEFVKMHVKTPKREFEIREGGIEVGFNWA